MLFRNGEKDPRVMIRIGSVLLLIFFGMKLVPHPTSSFADGVFDGVSGMMLGAAGSLMLWAAYLNGKRRRLRKN
ncbi:MAG TPA: hypothetical protein VIG78_01750 [Gemmatimonadaceae bacterium]|jgi:uncharacterized membrane protein YccC